jgi:hypothetical protein
VTPCEQWAVHRQVQQGGRRHHVRGRVEANLFVVYTKIGVWSRAASRLSADQWGTRRRSFISSRFPVFNLRPSFFTLSEVSEFLVEVYLSRASAGVVCRDLTTCRERRTG